MMRMIMQSSHRKVMIVLLVFLRGVWPLSYSSSSSSQNNVPKSEKVYYKNLEEISAYPTKERKILEFERDADDTVDIDVSAVEAILKERAIAKYNRDFDRSDELAQQLFNDYGVTINNRRRSWRAAPQKYTRDYDDLAEIPINIARALPKFLEERAVARRNRNFHQADHVLIQLAALGIHVNDETLKWAYLGPVYKQLHKKNSFSLDQDDEIEVLLLVEQRRRLKLARKFKQADLILSILLTDFSVCIDDQSRTWNTANKSTVKHLLHRLHNANNSSPHLTSITPAKANSAPHLSRYIAKTEAPSPKQQTKSNTRRDQPPSSSRD